MPGSVGTRILDDGSRFQALFPTPCPGAGGRGKLGALGKLPLWKVLMFLGNSGMTPYHPLQTRPSGISKSQSL